MNQITNNRYFLFAAAALALGISCTLSIGIILPFCMGALLLILFFFRKKAVFCILAVALAAGTLLCSAKINNIETLDDSWSNGVTVSGRVCEEPSLTENGVLLVLDSADIFCNSISTVPNGKILLFTTGSYRYGDIITASATLSEFSPSMNTGEIDKRISAKMDGLSFFAFAETALVTGNKQDLYGHFVSIRNSIVKNIKHFVPDKEVSDVLCAMTAGDKSSLSYQTKATFRDTGVSHLLSVSGLHIGLLTGFLSFILKRLHTPRPVYAIVLIAFILTYCAISAFAVSVMRAALMSMVLLLTSLTGRRYDSLNALGCAVCFLLIINPLMLTDAAFQLSVCACFGIAVFAKSFSKQKHFKKIVALLLTTAGASICTLPLMINYFGGFPIISLLANLLLIPIASLSLGISFFASILSLVYLPLGAPIAVAGWITELTYNAMQVLSKIPGIVAAPLQTVVLPLVLIFILSRFFKPKKSTKIILTSALTLIMLILNIAPTLDNRTYVNVLYTANALCVHIDTKGSHFLYDCGKSAVHSGKNSGSAEENVIPYLRHKGISELDGVFISHGDNDHSGGLFAIVKSGITVKNVYLAKNTVENDPLFDALINSLWRNGTDITYLSRGDRMSVNKTEFEVLLDGGGEDFSQNAASLVLCIVSQNKSVLLCGDTTFDREQELTEAGADILVAPHHGSFAANGMEFIQKVNPRAVIISRGTLYESNVEKTKALYESAHIDIFDTSSTGMVSCRLGEPLEIKPMRNYAND